MVALALWIIATEIAVVAVVLVIAFVKLGRETKNTLSETQTLVKSLEKRVDTLGAELENTAKNTTQAADHLKKTLSNTEKATSFLNAALPILSIVLLFRGITLPISSLPVGGKKEKQSSVLSTLMNVGKWLAILQQGFVIYKKYSRGKGGKGDGRQ